MFSFSQFSFPFSREVGHYRISKSKPNPKKGTCENCCKSVKVYKLFLFSFRWKRNTLNLLMVNKVRTSACLLRCCIISSSTNKDFLKKFILPQMCSMCDRSGLQAGQLSKQAYCFQPHSISGWSKWIMSHLFCFYQHNISWKHCHLTTYGKLF